MSVPAYCGNNWSGDGVNLYSIDGLKDVVLISGYLNPNQPSLSVMNLSMTVSKSKSSPPLGSSAVIKSEVFKNDNPT